jgi:hypothetical protein
LAFSQLVKFGYQKRRKPSHGDICAAFVVRIEGAQRHPLMVDHRSFEASRLPCDFLAMSTEPRTTATTTSQAGRHHEINMDTVARPRPRPDGERKASSFHGLGEERFVLKNHRVQCKVTIGGEWRDLEVSLSRMVVDCLRANQDHSVPVRMHRIQRIQQDPSCKDILWIDPRNIHGVGHLNACSA